MKTHMMTKWDVGQDLILCVDLIGDKEKDIREAGYDDVADLLKEARLVIGAQFNELKSHSFGLPEKGES